MGAPRPMTVDELYQHPEYDHTIWSLKPEIKEKVTVAKDRGGPIDIAYEVHGHGSRHMVVSLLCIPLQPKLAFLPHPVSESRQSSHQHLSCPRRSHNHFGIQPLPPLVMFLTSLFRFVSVALVVSAFKSDRLTFLMRKCSFHQAFQQHLPLARLGLTFPSLLSSIRNLQLHTLIVM
jgi:hypothetical protein